MRDTKFGVLAYTLYLLAGLGIAVAVISIIMNQGKSGAFYAQDSTTFFIIGSAIAIAFSGFTFHAIHDAILRHNQLLADIKTLLKMQVKAARPDTPSSETRTPLKAQPRSDSAR